MRKRLLDDISVNELLEFRNEGYTNSQIAEMLDVSNTTIYNMIGKMPDEMIAKAKREAAVQGGFARWEKAAKNKENVQTEGERKEMVENSAACLVVVNRKVNLQGTIGLYEVDCENKKVTMRPVEEIGFDNLNAYINELQAISRKIDQMSVGNEMW